MKCDRLAVSGCAQVFRLQPKLPTGICKLKGFSMASLKFGRDPARMRHQSRGRRWFSHHQCDEREKTRSCTRHPFPHFGPPPSARFCNTGSACLNDAQAVFSFSVHLKPCVRFSSLNAFERIDRNAVWERTSETDDLCDFSRPRARRCRNNSICE